MVQRQATLTKQIVLRVEPALYERLTRDAAAGHRSIAQQIRMELGTEPTRRLLLGEAILADAEGEG